MFYDFDLYHWKTKTWTTYRVEFRKDPIPGIHNRCSIGRYFRRMRTQNERKNFYAADPEFTRGRRRPRQLPTWWDDKIRTDQKSTSWKNCTKKSKQWQ